MKLWEKDNKTGDEVMKFTVGDDLSYDRLLAPYDILASVVHARMLGNCGLITQDESKTLSHALLEYYPRTLDATFTLDPEDEDIHSHLENFLVKNCGEAGKKIHTARSRNDQVMTAMMLFIKEQLSLVIGDLEQLFETLLDIAAKNKDVLIPGYTHTQVAMPSSVALWLGAYAESLVNDLTLIGSVVSIVDQNPLGSAAGFGSSFPIDRLETTREAGFSEMMVSPVSAQLNRGKTESLAATAMGSVASTLNRLASDMIFFMGQDTGFIQFPDELTTGSSIMPHKKNPDVLELIRAHCNMIMQLPSTLSSLTANLVSGYHRDFQLTKESLFPAFEKTRQVLSMMKLMVSKMKPVQDILAQEKYRYIYSVESVNQKVINGMAFRDAYREVGREIESGDFKPGPGVEYTHIGSIGDPGLNLIRQKKDKERKKIKIKSREELFRELLEKVK